MGVEEPHLRLMFSSTVVRGTGVSPNLPLSASTADQGGLVLR